MPLPARCLLAAAAFAAAMSSVSAHPEEVYEVSDSVLVLHDDGASPVERNAIDVFARRLGDRSGLDVVVVGEDEAVGERAAGQSYGLVVLAGVLRDHGGILRGYAADPQPGDEGFHIVVADNHGWAADVFPDTKRLAVVSGRDSRGLLYGLGKLLRLGDFADGGFVISPQSCVETPATSQRGVYFATHFNNYYERAPVEELEAYVEDMALWGFNAIWTWFDMNWYPEGFWEDPEDPGTQMLNRIRMVNAKARSLGLTAGLTAIANEGFQEQPPEGLRADMSVRRGGFYPDSTICPSAPGGMEMILKNRRKVLELIGPIDAYVTWPFDQGSCGCPECSPWAEKFMEINPAIAEEVRRLNPDVAFHVSTWYFTDDEMAMVRSVMDEGAAWFDGVVTETKWAGEFEPPASYDRIVFPEISMEGSLFCGYGASGANPMPTKCVEQARQAAAHGYGSMLYSEGVYEDVNKIVWGSALWEPGRDLKDIVGEYARFYFGPDRVADWRDLILGLEQTWPPETLNTKDPALVEKLCGLAKELGATIPATQTSRIRWQYLMDRAEMDLRMVRVGADEGLLREARALLTDAGYARDMQALRRNVQDLRDKAAARAEAVEALFQFHWEYLGRAHLDRTTSLVTTPPGFIGQRDWDRLATALGKALADADDEDMRMAVLKGFKEWFWHNNITLDFLFL